MNAKFHIQYVIIIDPLREYSRYWGISGEEEVAKGYGTRKVGYLTSSGIWGATMDPTRPTMEQKPSSEWRACVGNSSDVYM